MVVSYFLACLVLIGSCFLQNVTLISYFYLLLVKVPKFVARSLLLSVSLLNVVVTLNWIIWLMK